MTSTTFTVEIELAAGVLADIWECGLSVGTRTMVLFFGKAWRRSRGKYLSAFVLSCFGPVIVKPPVLK